MYIQSNSVKNDTTIATYTYTCTNDAQILPPEIDDPVISDSDKPVITSDSDKPVQSDSDKPAQSDSDKPAESDSDKPAESDSDKPSNSDIDVPDTDFGDYDENGKTELKDAYAIQADVLAKKTFTADQIAKCDVNHDGKISLKDASLIQQYRAGLVVLK